MSISLRPPAVAGMFYPDSPAVLSRDISRMLETAVQEMSGKALQLRPKAIIVPHAGYVYSGPIAASIYALLKPLRDTIRRVVLLGPVHHVAIDGLALPSSTAFTTPLGEIQIDQQAVSGIQDLPQIITSDAAHGPEHSLEVQLPFLQTLFSHFSLLPLAVGHTSPEAVGEVLEKLWGGEETLIVVSSDLSHFLPYNAARAIDEETARHIMSLDPLISHQQACGASPINGLLHAARMHGMQARLIDLRNSGDTAGDKSRVVGYGAFAFMEREHHVH